MEDSERRIPSSSSTIKIEWGIDSGFLGDGRACFQCGQFDYKTGAYRHIVFGSNQTVVLGDDARGDSQTETCAAIFGGEIWKKQPLFVIGRNTMTAIGNCEFNGFMVRPETGSQTKVSYGGSLHGFGRIVYKVHDHALHQFIVGPDHRQVCSEIGLNCDFLKLSMKSFQRGLNDAVRFRGRKARGR